MAEEIRPSAIRLLGALVGVVATQVVGMVVGYQAVIGVLFAPLTGIPVTLVLVAALIVVSAAAIHLATGRWRFAPAVAATLVSCAVFVALIVRAGQLPMMWIPALSIDAGSLVAGLVGGLTAAVFLPRPEFRVAGAAVLVAAVAFFAVPAITESVVAQQERDAADRAAREQATEDYLRSVTRPATIDDESAEVVIFGVGEYVSTLRVVVDDEVTFDVQTVPDSPDTGRIELLCWLMVRDVGSLDETVTMDDYDGVCTYDGAGRWETTDGSAVAVEVDDVVVIVRTPLPEYPLEDPAWRAATPAEIDDAVPQLRRMSVDEFRAFYLAWWEQHG